MWVRCASGTSSWLLKCIPLQLQRGRGVSFFCRSSVSAMQNNTVCCWMRKNVGKRTKQMAGMKYKWPAVNCVFVKRSRIIWHFRLISWVLKLSCIIPQIYGHTLYCLYLFVRLFISSCLNYFMLSTWSSHSYQHRDDQDENKMPEWCPEMVR